jgi:hypothetical protein
MTVVRHCCFKSNARSIDDAKLGSLYPVCEYLVEKTNAQVQMPLDLYSLEQKKNPDNYLKGNGTVIENTRQWRFNFEVKAQVRVDQDSATKSWVKQSPCVISIPPAVYTVDDTIVNPKFKVMAMFLVALSTLSAIALAGLLLG